MTLKSLRLQKNLSQVEAAKIASVPIRSYKRYENDVKYKGSVKYNFIFDKLSQYKVNKQNKGRIKKENVVIVGIGYVGLSSAILLSKKAKITLVDNNIEKIDKINKHISPIPNAEIVKAMQYTEFQATNKLSVYKNANVVIVAINTDLDENKNRLDTKSVLDVVRSIREINKDCLIVIKSTVPVGFTDQLISLYGQSIIFVPEFLRENTAFYDAFYPSRLIIGCNKVTSEVKKFEKLLCASFKNQTNVIYMSNKNAEAVKLFSNTYLAMRVAFFNELDSFALKANLDANVIINGLGEDPRIGDSYNNPSLMYSGYCLPKDTLEISEEVNDIENNQLIKSIDKSNNARLEFIKKEIIAEAKKITTKSSVTIGIYNLETSKTVNGYRMSSSVALLKSLEKDHIKVVVYDEIYNQSIKDFDKFVESSDLIVANRIDSRIKKYSHKLFTRSIY